jgi:hypothetical protein
MLTAGSCRTCAQSAKADMNGVPTLPVASAVRTP